MHDVAPADDDDPFGHFLHLYDPVVPAYVPAKHDLHVDPAADELDPFAQSVQDDTPADDDDPFGH